MLDKLRRISLEKDFMDWSKDDRMYAYLLQHATYNPDTKQLYMDREVYKKHRKTIMNICEYRSEQSLKNNLDKWLNSGLINLDVKDGVIIYVFKDYDPNGRYQMINWEILDYFFKIGTRKHVVRIYVYLLNKWLYHHKEACTFTLREIGRAIGYQVDGRLDSDCADKIIVALQFLERVGLISVKSFYLTKLINETEIPVCYHSIVKVAQHISELSPVTNYTERKKIEEQYEEQKIEITHADIRKVKCSVQNKDSDESDKMWEELERTL